MAQKLTITNLLYPRAMCIAETLRDAGLLGGHWDGWNSGFYGRNKAADAIAYRANSYEPLCEVVFTKIRPSKITKAKYGPITTLKSEVVDSNISVIRNTSTSMTLIRSYTYKKSETNSNAEEVGVNVRTMLEQEISYGGETSPVSGSTLLQLEVAASYLKTTSNEVEKGKEITDVIEVPPKCVATIITTTTRADCEQECEFTADFDHTVEVHNGGVSRFKWDNMHRLAQTLRGMGFEWQEHRLTERLGDSPLAKNLIDDIIRPLSSPVSYTNTFSNVSKGEVVISQEPIA